MTLGLPYVEFLVKPGTAEGIGQFYKEVMHAPCTLTRGRQGAVTQVRAGREQKLIFRETTENLPAYDGHHIAVYLANFSGPYTFLKRQNLITQESDAHQYRFQDIVHPKTGRTLYVIEHEVRSLYHPMYGRELINRNPSQNIRAYVQNRDAFSP